MSKIKNVAIIMDGNGRWALNKLHPRIWGHVKGASRVNQVAEEASDLGLKSLTLYAFSTENWKRPQKEIQTLFKLLRKYLDRETDYIIKNKIRFRVIGSIVSLPQITQELILNLENETKEFKGLELNFAFDYGSKKEIIESVNKYILKNPGKIISEEQFEKNLDLPQIDLLIRTGGDLRVSNFLLWQLAYAELFFTTTKWPDFTRKEFQQIVKKVSNRERRFGGV